MVCVRILYKVSTQNRSSVFIDISVNVYHVSQAEIVRPSYAGYVVSTVYLFLPLPGLYHPTILGCVVSLIYAAEFLLITTMDTTIKLSDIAIVVPEIFFLLGLNIIGVTNRWKREIITRLLFLTKRQSVEQAVAFKYAKDQEASGLELLPKVKQFKFLILLLQKNLLVSIIPEPIAKKIGQEVRYRIERSKISHEELYEGRYLYCGNPLYKLKPIMYFVQLFRTFFLEPHEDVSIIFADLVNFTFLTTQLDVKTLVETLHDLFQRFDKACQVSPCLKYFRNDNFAYCLSRTIM